MKRFFSMMLILASLFTIGCDNDNDDNDDDKPETTLYSGTQTVSVYGGPFAGVYNNPARILVEECPEYANITLLDACFTSGMDLETHMPALNIVLPNITSIDDDDVYYAEKAIPTMTDGEPFGDDTIKSVDNVSLVFADDKVVMSFNCTVAIDMMGTGDKTEVTFPVSFTALD